MTKVSFSKSPDYSAENVATAIETAVARIGGWNAFIVPGKKVLIKPNMLSDHPPEDAVTTHPEVLRAVIRAVKENGGIVSVGDSPASAVTVPQIWKKTGIESVCKEENVPLITFERGEPHRIIRDGFTFTLTPALYDSDIVINLPKVKTHALTTFTCAVKNLYGCVPGYQKAAIHKEYPNPCDFGKLLLAILAEVKPTLSIADGIIGMDGEGPSSGDPVQLGFIAASADPIALDIEICKVLGIPVKNVPYLSDPAKSPDYSSIETVGTSADELRPKKFRIPITMKGRIIPKWLVRLVSPFIWVRPFFDETKCIQCGRCVKLCPPRALHFTNSNKADRKKMPPTLAGCESNCIGCCCCHEMCPAKAIKMQQSPLLRLYGAFKGL